MMAFRSIPMLMAAVAAGAMAAPALAQDAAAPAPAAAPAASATASVTAGTAVVDTTGAAVGTIESVNGDLAVLATTKSKVSLPLASFAAGPKGLVISMTQAEVDAAAAGATAQQTATATADAQAKAAEQVVKGAQVSDTSGASVGTIEAVEGEFATVATANSKVRLPLSAFGPGESGPVIAMTATELEAAATAAAPKTGTN